MFSTPLSERKCFQKNKYLPRGQRKLLGNSSNDLLNYRVATHQHKTNSDFSLTTNQFSLTMMDEYFGSKGTKKLIHEYFFNNITLPTI